MKRMISNNRRYIKNIAQWLLPALLLLVALLVLHNAITMGRIITTGQLEKIRPSPFYGFLKNIDIGRDENNNLRPDYIANLALCQQIEKNCFGIEQKYGTDYANMYLPAQFYKTTGVIYDKKQNLGLGYYYGTPFAYFLLSHSFLTELDFSSSHVFFMTLQLFVFFAVVLYFLKGAKKSYRDIFLLYLLMLFLLFNSRIGLAFFERGQFYVFNGAAILLLLKGFRDNRMVDFIGAGLLAALRFSFLPPLFFIIVAWFVFSWRNSIIKRKFSLSSYLNQHGKKIIGSGLAMALPFLLLLPFATREVTTLFAWLQDYVQGQNINFSLFYYFHQVGYVLPFLLIVFYFLLSLNKKFLKTNYQPSEHFFWCGLTWWGLRYSSIPYEYVVTAMLSMVILLFDKRSILFATLPTKKSPTAPTPQWLLVCWFVLLIMISRLYNYIFGTMIFIENLRIPGIDIIMIIIMLFFTLRYLPFASREATATKKF